MATRARRISSATGEADDGGDAWVLNGAKRWIGNGTFCDYMLVWACDEADGSVRGFIVDASLPGVSRTRIENKIALRTVQNADIVLDEVHVAEADRFPSISSFADTRELLRGSRIMVAWQAVGQQLAAFDVARQYAVERRQFGRPLAHFQLIQQQLVTMLGNAVASMGMMAGLARLQDAGAADMPQVALAKSYLSARMRETVALGRSILGGNGIVTDYRMAKIFSDAEAIYTYEGSFEINTLIVGRAVTGISAIT
jgi:glutaryl-CoA dehydrogenase